MSPVSAIKIMSHDDIACLYLLTRGAGHGTEAAYFERTLEEQEKGKRLLFVYPDPAGGRIPLGYVQYNREPQYAPFRRFGIPEIQDLFVSPDHRRGGIGGALIARCEDQARSEYHDEIGIGVGIIASYGNAQRLYVSKGYVPDGAGVTFDRQTLAAGELRPLDDRLCLMLIKKL